MFFFWFEPDLHNHLSLQLSSLKLIEAYVGSALYKLQPMFLFMGLFGSERTLRTQPTFL